MSKLDQSQIVPVWEPEAETMIKMLKTLMLLCVIVASITPLSAFAVAPRAETAAIYEVGSIVIKTKTRELLYIKSLTETIRYPIAVGRAGRDWTGTTTVSRMVRNPIWAPPPAIRRDNPKLPKLVKPGPNNPLGVAVLVLGDGTYGIHGTNKDESIGKAASYGCFRMHNADVLALFEAVSIGTKVYVLR